MRDALLALFLLSAFPMVIYRYQVGAMVIVLISFMYPQSNTYGFALSVQWLDYFVLCTIVGYFLGQGYREYKHHHLITLLIIFYLWTCLTTYFSIDINYSFEPWVKFTKVFILALIVYTSCLNEKRLTVFIKIIVISIAYYGIKGGLFTIVSGGYSHVLGPPNSFFSDNNRMSLVLVMGLPFMIFFIIQAKNIYEKYFAIFCSLCTAVAVLGTQSRTGFAALLVSISYYLWLQKKLFKPALFIIPIVGIAVFFMPDSWSDRMITTSDVETDNSFQGRIEMWEASIKIAADHPVKGGGFNVIYVPEVIIRYIPLDVVTRAIHSTYFQMLAEHGYTGFIMFLLLLAIMFREARKISRNCIGNIRLYYYSDLSAAIRSSLVGYMVISFTSNIAFFDFLYFILAILAIAAINLERENNPHKIKLGPPHLAHAR